MNQEKMANFICQLRKEKKLSQESLANILFVGREAVSKWERGKTIPEPNILLHLSEYFNVSINELLYGERKSTKNQKEINKVSLNLYRRQKKNKKIIKFLLSIIVLFIFLFLLLYFFLNYNSVSVYEITKYSNDLNITNGVIVSTNDKIYFYSGTLKSDKLITKIELYYKDNNLSRNFITSTTNKNYMSFSDSLGYGEYFDFKNKEYIINNLWVEVTFDDGKVTNVMLNPSKFISNDHFFPKKVKF